VTLEPPLPVPDDDSLDAATSALVDGVATPEEAALVAASPDGAARLAALQAVSEAVGRPGPAQDPAAADRALAAALAAFDTAALDTAGTDQAPGEEREDAPVLAPRVGSPGSVRWLPRLGAVAAALVLLVGLAVLTVDLLGRAGDPGTATSDDVAAAPTSPAAGRPGGTEGATAMARAEAAEVIDGGAFGNETAVEAIALRAGAAFDSPPVPSPAAATTLPADLQRCVKAGPSTVSEKVGAPLYQAEGTFQGIPAVAIAYQRDGDPPRLLLVLNRNDCSLLERTPF